MRLECENVNYLCVMFTFPCDKSKSHVKMCEYVQFTCDAAADFMHQVLFPLCSNSNPSVKQDNHIWKCKFCGNVVICGNVHSWLKKDNHKYPVPLPHIICTWLPFGSHVKMSCHRTTFSAHKWNCKFHM